MPGGREQRFLSLCFVSEGSHDDQLPQTGRDRRGEVRDHASTVRRAVAGRCGRRSCLGAESFQKHLQGFCLLLLTRKNGRSGSVVVLRDRTLQLAYLEFIRPVRLCSQALAVRFMRPFARMREVRGEGIVLRVLADEPYALRGRAADQAGEQGAPPVLREVAGRVPSPAPSTRPCSPRIRVRRICLRRARCGRTVPGDRMRRRLCARFSSENTKHCVRLSTSRWWLRPFKEDPPCCVPFDTSRRRRLLARPTRRASGERITALTVNAEARFIT